MITVPSGQNNSNTQSGRRTLPQVNTTQGTRTPTPMAAPSDNDNEDDEEPEFEEAVLDIPEMSAIDRLAKMALD